MNKNAEKKSQNLVNIFVLGKKMSGKNFIISKRSTVIKEKSLCVSREGAGSVFPTLI
jgi:hypothetical protein